MPKASFTCDRCGEVFRALVATADLRDRGSATGECPRCHYVGTHRLIDVDAPEPVRRIGAAHDR
jgi:hypothetical protein